MAEPVVTELVITSDNRGEVEYTRAMETARLAAAAAFAANDNFARSMRTSSDDARDAADSNNSLTLGLRQLAQSALESAEAFAKKVAVTTAVVGTLGLLARVLLPLYATYRLVKGAIETVTEAWRLASEQIENYVEMARKVAELRLPIEFFQRMTRAADDAKLKVDDLVESFKRLREATDDRLGGSEGGKRLQELIDAGNFKGNPGVAQLASANTLEERFRAISTLINSAIDNGERLAALDIAKTYLGPKVTENLAKDDEYLKKMIASADKMAAEKLISDEDVGNALWLQQRLDAAEKILSQRWHPVQDLLTSLGMKMKEVWVGIVEAIASAFDWVSRFVDKLLAIPSWLINKFVDLTTTPESRAKADAEAGLMLVGDKDKDPDWQREIARQRLDNMLKNPANVARSVDESNNVVRGVFKDKSKVPGTVSDNGPDTSAYARAEESLLRYIEMTKAAAGAVEAGAAAQERARAIAQLTAAGLKDGLSPAAAAAKAEMSGLADRAAAAAEALARARVEAQLNFGRRTAFLSQEDIQIAQQLKAIYPDVADALSSVEAQSMRVFNAMRQVASAIETGLVSGLADAIDRSKSLGDAFRDMSRTIIRALEEAMIKMLIVAPIMRGLQTLMGGFGFGGVPSVGSFTGQDAALNAAIFPGYGTGMGMNAAGNDNWRGGLTSINEHGGEIVDLPSGTRIIPHDVSMQMAGNAGNDGVAIAFGDINITLPEGTSPDNAAAIGAAVKASMMQVVDERVAYHMRARGMLNRAA